MTATEAGPALRLTDVDKRFRGRWALRDCTFELPRGRISALVGANGAGKSTLLLLATGLLRPTSGTVEVLGTAPTRSGMPAGASFLAQDTPLYPTFRVAEILRAAAALNTRGRWDGVYAARLVADAGVGADQRIRDLSAGGRARVALAVAMGRRPDLLLLDEPLSALDPLARREVMGTVLAEAGDTGTTVLMSSHIVAELEQACDHLVLLQHGSVALSGDIPTLLDEHRLLTGPGPAELPGAVRTSTSGRQTVALVRGAESPPGFADERPSLDDIVLAYLRERPEAAA